MAKHRIYTPMSNVQRAKQFAPFAALRGFEEAILLKEQLIVPKKDLSEHQAERLDQQFHQLCSGDEITVTYYNHISSCYAQVCATVQSIDTSTRHLHLDSMTIPMDDIFEISDLWQ